MLGDKSARLRNITQQMFKHIALIPPRCMPACATFGGLQIVGSQFCGSSRRTGTRATERDLISNRARHCKKNAPQTHVEGAPLHACSLKGFSPTAFCAVGNLRQFLAACKRALDHRSRIDSVCPHDIIIVSAFARVAKMARPYVTGPRKRVARNS